MSAFCVFGISKSLCKTTAEKKTPSYDKDLNRYLTMAEWAEKRDAMTESLFAESTRLVKVSPQFDAPQFCADWLAVDPAHIRMPVVMVRGPKVDKNDVPVKRNGAQVMTWLQYHPKSRRI